MTVPSTLAERVVELEAEVNRLRAVWDEAARIVQAARHHFEHYAQDEADDVEDCVCGEDQHRAARELRDALAAAPEVPRD